MTMSDRPCWSCGAPAGPDDLRCPSCKALQPEPPGADLFSALGLPRAYAVDGEDLEKRFRERSRLFHPDRHARGSPRERRISLERSTRLNDAHRALRDPRRRAAYLLKLLGHDPAVEARSLHDPEFLEEQLELRETLAGARAANDERALRLVAMGARDRLAALDEEIAARFAEPGLGEDGLRAIAIALMRARYFENVVAEAEPAAARHP